MSAALVPDPMRVEALREQAARRGIKEPQEEGRIVWSPPGWDDVQFLIAEIDELRAALNDA